MPNTEGNYTIEATKGESLIIHWFAKTSYIIAGIHKSE